MRHQISEENYKILQNRSNLFSSLLDKPDKDPVKVFDPLSAKQLEELELIRDISIYLKAKKLEDVNMQAQNEEEKPQVKETKEVTEEQKS